MTLFAGEGHGTCRALFLLPVYSPSCGESRVSFDIDSLLHFQAPQYQCQKCRALFLQLPIRGTELYHGKSPLKCPVCQVEYLPTAHYPREKWADYLSGVYHPRIFERSFSFQHAIGLARIAERMRNYHQNPTSEFKYVPLRALFEALSYAEIFVQFTTYGIHPLIIGALKLASQRLFVRGIMSGAKGEMISEAVLSELNDEDQEAPLMKVKHYGADAGYKGMPHQKLVIIDGLLAFKGAANLTLAGWRKAAHGRDVVEVVTKVDEIIDLNNRLFSPIWAELSHEGDTIDMQAPTT